MNLENSSEKKIIFALKKNILFKIFSFCLLFCLIITPAKKAYAESFFSLTSSEIKYQQKSIDIELFFSLINVEEVEKVLKSGSSINIDYRATLFEENTFLPDSDLSYYISGRQIRYDALTHEFFMYHENNAPQKSEDLKDLLEKEFSRIECPIMLFEPLEEDENYYIQLDFGLRHATIPPWLESTLFFWEWDITGDSYIIEVPHS